MRRKKLMHFSHHHPLHETNVKQEDGLVCTCCWQDISGPGFICKHDECDFLMHKSCVELPQRIRHKSHPAHVLTLVSGREFNCNACGGAGGAGFTYNCPVCDYDIHVKCSILPEIVKREDHEHPVRLQYAMVCDDNDVEFVCDVCERVANPGCWVYYCRDCDFGTHLDCALHVKRKEAGQQKEDAKLAADVPRGASSGSYDPVALANLQIRAQEQLQLNQMKMQTSFLEAQRQRDNEKYLLKLWD